jgi:hypothetical protein
MIDQSAAKCRTGTGYQKIAMISIATTMVATRAIQYMLIVVPIYHDRP